MPSASPALHRAFAETRLHIVTGKGGTGKTTVAAALAMALASTGRHVLLVEVEGRQGISQTFDVPPLGVAEVPLVTDPGGPGGPGDPSGEGGGGELWGLSVDAKAALLEYLQTFYKLGRAGAALEKVGAIDFATTIAPGVRDVLLIGKVYEAAGRTSGQRRGQGELVWDAVVLDAPPTGRVARFLNVNSEVADLAKVGPIRSQADSITALLRSRATVVHLVTLLEEMPVQETIDAAAELSAQGLGLGCVIVNQERDALLSPAAITALTDPTLEGQIRADLTTAGMRPTGPMVRGLIQEGVEHAQRLTLEDDMLVDLADQGLPLVHLPALAEGVDDGGIAVLADLLLEQGVQ